MASFDPDTGERIHPAPSASGGSSVDPPVNPWSRALTVVWIAAASLAALAALVGAGLSPSGGDPDLPRPSDTAFTLAGWLVALAVLAAVAQIAVRAAAWRPPDDRSRPGG